MGKAIFKKIDFNLFDGFNLLCFCLVCGLFFSRAILSISCVLLLLQAIYSYFKAPFKLQQSKLVIAFFFIYACYALRILAGGENLAYGLHLLFNHALLLLLPSAFLFKRKIFSKLLYQIGWVFIACASLSLSILSIQVLVDFDAFVSAVEASKNVEPVIGSHHSNLNLLYVIAFGFGLVTAEKENRPWARLLLLILLGLMFFQLHLIAFRFSVIAVYIFLALYLIRWLLTSNRKSVWLALFMVLFFAVVFSFVPSINARYQNTVQDLKVFKQNKNPNFNSLTQRILALDCAYKIILRHPLYGVSPTIAEQRMQEQYALNSYLLIPENRVFVHNQFAYFLLCFGVLGGAVLALVILWLIFKQFTTKGYGWILLPFVLHMLIENTLEKQITLAAFIFLVLIIQKHQQTINATN